MRNRLEQDCKVNIIGAGLAGLSAALKLSEAGVRSRLISLQTSERAQSNLAEGGINACMNVMGEDDHAYEHFEDTVRGGCGLADPNMAAGLCLAAPDIIRELISYGVPFNREEGKLIQRNFGGQKKKRTTFSKSSTGKVITAALIDAVRKYECEGLVERLPHHEFRHLVIEEENCLGVLVRDTYTGKERFLAGSVILAMGGMNGMFSGRTTGSTANTGKAASVLFAQGVEMANLEMIQYHPTTVQIAGKRMLISEAARGEGGRLFYYENDGKGGQRKVWFMEDKYGERGNLMPRDVVSREMASGGKEIYLDLTGIPARTWEKKLSDLREEIIHYMAIDPCLAPVPVAPGIHFFMGGVRIDETHRTNLRGLYAAGECACGYHGANRLGGNSLLAAIYGGKAAAQSASEEISYLNGAGQNIATSKEPLFADDPNRQFGEIDAEVSRILISHLPVLTSEALMQEGLDRIRELKCKAAGSDGDIKWTVSYCRILLAEAILMSAIARKESRGAHTVKEYPERSEELRKTTTAQYRQEKIQIAFARIPELREEIRERLYENKQTEDRK